MRARVTTFAIALSLVSLADGFIDVHSCRRRTVADRRCRTPTASTLDAAKDAWLAKLDVPWQRGSVVPTAPVLSIPNALAEYAGPAASTHHELVSLEDTFGPEFAECFHSCPEFRTDIIGCASDVGSLFSRGTDTVVPEFDEDGCRKRLGDVLARHLGASAPTADEFVFAFSSLCGSSFRWGAFTCFGGAVAEGSPTYFETQPGAFAQEWHQDWAAAEVAHMFGESRTVMFVFPPAGTRGHEGSGLFTELVKLTHEFVTETLKCTTSRYRGLTTAEADRKAAAELSVTDAHIVRPYYRRGAELLRYKDSEHLHRSPRSNSDPVGRKRQAIWRFQ